LKQREIRSAIGGGDNNLAVNDGRACLDTPGVVGDFLETVRPVVASPCENSSRLVGQMDLHTVTVELDFVNPSPARRHLLNGSRQGRFDEVRQWPLADTCRFVPLKRHRSLHATADSN
jgi:hypothetical protein